MLSNEDSEEVLFNKNSRGRGQRGQRKFGFSQSRGGYGTGFRGNSNKYVTNKNTSYANKDNRRNKRSVNRPDHTGNPSKCTICHSIMHWYEDCPHKETDDEITLFTKGTQQKYTHYFTGETFNSAILDSGCSTTVCGKIWYDCYVDSLTDEQCKDIKEEESSTRFRFGDGVSIQSIKKAIIPAKIGNKNVKIETDIVEAEIPLLLSKNSMKRADTKLDFVNDTVDMFGEELKLNFTSSGHYLINLCSPDSQILHESKILFSINEASDDEKTKMALKLHSQFGHAKSERIIELVKDAGTGDDAFFDCIKSVEENCDICKRFKKPKARPVVGFTLAKDFNEVVSMDLKDIKQHKIFHMIDHATRYSAGSVIKGKSKEIIVDNFFKHWVAIFGCPEKILSDNGREFNNGLFREMAELLNVEVMTTAAESPWSNGITERHNALIEQMTIEIMEETNCSIDVALAWGLSAKNSVKMVYAGLWVFAKSAGIWSKPKYTHCFKQQITSTRWYLIK